MRIAPFDDRLIFGRGSLVLAKGVTEMRSLNRDLQRHARCHDFGIFLTPVFFYVVDGFQPQREAGCGRCDARGGNSSDGCR
jgi:hypothetical protein